jgi:hypothetical protein
MESILLRSILRVLPDATFAGPSPDAFDKGFSFPVTVVWLFLLPVIGTAAIMIAASFLRSYFRPPYDESESTPIPGDDEGTSP